MSKKSYLPPKLQVDNRVRPYVSNGSTFQEGYGAALTHTQESFNAWYAEHIEPLFANAVEVYGAINQDGSMENIYSTDKEKFDTHRALLIGVTPIERGVTVDEIVRELEYNTDRASLIDLINRLKREGIKP